MRKKMDQIFKYLIVATIVLTSQIVYAQDGDFFLGSAANAYKLTLQLSGHL